MTGPIVRFQVAENGDLCRAARLCRVGPLRGLINGQDGSERFYTRPADCHGKQRDRGGEQQAGSAGLPHQ